MLHVYTGSACLVCPGKPGDPHQGSESQNEEKTLSLKDMLSKIFELKNSKRYLFLCKALPQWCEENRMLKEIFLILSYEVKFTFKLCASVLYVALQMFSSLSCKEFSPLPTPSPRPCLNLSSVLCIAWHQPVSFHGGQLGRSWLLATFNIQKLEKNVFQQFFIQVW